MKTTIISACLCACLILTVLFFPCQANAQQPPILKFNSFNLDSGTALTTGAVYRFYNVNTGVDALVKISAINGGISLRNIDRTADGYSEAFQPEYKINGITNGYVDFTIRFVTAGTSTPTTLPLVSATGLDIDGSPNGSSYLKEYNQIDMGGGSYEFNTINSELTVSETGTNVSGNNATGNLYGALVDTAAKEVMFTVTNTNVSVMTYRIGSNNQTSANSNRYASLYYKKFTYQHFPLAISGLLSFDAVAMNNKVKLSWELQSGKYSKVVLEKSNSATSFNTVYEEEVTATVKSGYTDADIFGSNVFYRLKAISLEGKTEYSSIVSVKMTSCLPGQMKVFPSLIQSGTTVAVDMKEKSTGTLFVADYSGRVVKQQQLNLQAGSNSIALDGLDQFSKGNYIVAVRTGNNLLTQKVIIQ